MFAKLTVFIKSLSDEDTTSAHDDITLEIACAVLLCEVMRADGDFSHDENKKIAELLSKHFNLSNSEVDEIIDKATFLSEHATDFFQFTSKINQHYSIKERMKIVDLLWEMAYADGELACIEEHIIRKIADLLHLRHGEYIQTKTKAKFQ